MDGRALTEIKAAAPAVNHAFGRVLPDVAPVRTVLE